jgi:hypothetical protein
MSLRGLLLVLLLIGALIYFFGKPDQWLRSLHRAGAQEYAVPTDTMR